MWGLLVASALAANVQIPVYGMYMDATGAPLDGSRSVTVALVTEGGAVVHTETLTVAFVSGQFALQLGVGQQELRAHVRRDHDGVVGYVQDDPGRPAWHWLTVHDSSSRRRC